MTNLNPFLRWVRENEFLSWAGIVLGLISLAGGPLVGWTTLPGLTLIALGGALAASLVVAFVLLPPKYPFECLESDTQYELNGLRGQTATGFETARMRAKSNIPPGESFSLGLKRASVVTTDTYTLMNTGPNGDNRNAAARQVLVIGRDLIAVPAADGSTTLTILAPFSIRRNDIIVVERRTTVQHCFDSDDEFVGKLVIYPTVTLRLKVIFSGCLVNNCLGTRFQGGRATESVPLTPNAAGGSCVLPWEVHDCRPGENYRLSWRWT